MNRSKINRKKRKNIFKSIPFTNRNSKKPGKTVTIHSATIKKFEALIGKMMDNTRTVFTCSSKRKKHKYRKKTSCKRKAKKSVRPIRVAAVCFVETQYKNLLAANEFHSAPVQNTSLSQSNMYMISNRSSSATIEAQIEISPNNVDYSVDTATIIVKPMQNYTVIPLRFAKYTRISYRTIEQGEFAFIDLFYQSQELPV